MKVEVLTVDDDRLPGPHRWLMAQCGEVVYVLVERSAAVPELALGLAARTVAGLQLLLAPVDGGAELGQRVTHAHV